MGRMCSKGRIENKERKEKKKWNTSLSGIVFIRCGSQSTPQIFDCRFIMQVPSSSQMPTCLVACRSGESLNLNHRMPEHFEKNVIGEKEYFTISSSIPWIVGKLPFIILPHGMSSACTSLFGPSKHNMQGPLGLMMLGWGSSAWHG